MDPVPDYSVGDRKASTHRSDLLFADWTWIREHWRRRRKLFGIYPHLRNNVMELFNSHSAIEARSFPWATIRTVQWTHSSGFIRSFSSPERVQSMDWKGGYKISFQYIDLIPVPIHTMTHKQGGRKKWMVMTGHFHMDSTCYCRLQVCDTTVYSLSRASAKKWFFFSLDAEPNC